MLSKKRYYENRETLLKCRIKELENIICPAEQHDFVVVDEKMDIIDGYGSAVYHRRYVCKRCLKAVEKTEVT